VSTKGPAHDVVEAGWRPRLRAGASKGADAEMATGRLDLAGRKENRGNLGRAIPLNPSLFSKNQPV